MSIEFISLAWGAPLKPLEKLVLLAIADHADKSGYAFPGYDLLTKKTGISRATLSKGIKVLKDAGVITIKSRGSIGKGRKANGYQINSEILKSLDIELIGKARKVHALKSSAFPRKVQFVNSSPRETISSAVEQEPSLEPSIKTNMSKQVSLDRFDDFWTLYPRKEGKKKALVTWRRLNKSNKDKAIEDIRYRYATTDKKFIPLPARYLNDERWNDEVHHGGEVGPKSWRESASGITAKGEEYGLSVNDFDRFTDFKVAVFKKESQE